MKHVRKAVPGDIPRILMLLEQVNMVHHDSRPDLFRGPTTKYSAEELEQILSIPDRPIFVCADPNGYVMGYAFCVVSQYENDRLMTDVKTLYIDDLCVDEALRGQHVGRTLYEHVVRYARSIGCYILTLNVWALNEGARRFYEKCGLKPQKIGMETIL